jgi:hypothetical protein
MNFTETFDQFSSRVGPRDLALYAGVGLALWVIFKDKLSPVQKIILDVTNKAKALLSTNKSSVISSLPVATTVVPVPAKSNDSAASTEDIFFRLIVSWKQTRDLAVQSKCEEAVRVADEMFPFLSPNVCQGKKVNSNE